MNMKKIISWGMMLAAAFTLTNCAKEIENPNQQPEVTGYPFEIIASTVDTKTVNDDMSTKWAAEDKINLIHKESGNTEASYVSEEAFTIASEDLADGRFTGTLANPLVSGSHDWYVLYPYSSFTKTPEKSGYLPIGCEPAKNQVQIQEGNSSMAHIAGPNYPLWGNVKGVAHDEKPELVMSHVSSLIKVVVTNATETPLTVENIAFTAPVDILGTYYINFAGENVVCTNSGTQYVSKTATLNVNNGEAIEAGMSAEFYLAVRPFTAEAGSSLTLAVNGYSKVPKALTNDITFHAGKIKTLNFAYDYVAPAGEQTVTFDFTSAEELADLGITLPDVDGGTNVTSLAKGQVTLVAEGGSTITRIYNSAGKYDLRAYKGATLTFSVPSGYIITDVTLEGSATSISTSVVPSNPVVLTVAADASTQKISKITVTYAEGEVEVVPLTMNEVECANATSNSLTFTWLPVDGAVGYKVSVDGGVNYGEVQDETSYTWENLEPETEYTLYVKAIGNGLNTSDSEPVSSMATTDEEQEGVVTMSTTFTFTGSNGQKEFTVTKAPIKIAFAKGNGSNLPYDHSNEHIRVYTGNTMTFSGGTIVKIELKYSDTNYPGTGTTANGGTLSQNTTTKTWTWVGNSTTVVLTGGSKQGRYDSITVYYESNGTPPDPIQLTMSDVTCSAQTANSLTFKWDTVDGATGYEVSFDGGEAETITEKTYTAEGLDPESEYEISVKAIGDGTYYLTSDSKTCSATTTAASTVPSGNTYTKYSGTLVEGDYIIVYNSYAMTASVSSDRFTNTTVSPSNNTITNPDESIVWHIAKSGDYWTIYNDKVGKYAASTGAKNKAQLLASGTDDKSLWTVTGTSTYEFVNKKNKANGVNSNLRNNNTYGFACYATGTGGALTLYKKN